MASDIPGTPMLDFSHSGDPFAPLTGVGALQQREEMLRRQEQERIERNWDKR